LLNLKNATILILHFVILCFLFFHIGFSEGEVFVDKINPAKNELLTMCWLSFVVCKMLLINSGIWVFNRIEQVLNIL